MPQNPEITGPSSPAAREAVPLAVSSSPGWAGLRPHPRISRRVVIWLACCGWFAPSPVFSAEPTPTAPKQEFLRIRRGEDREPLSLETALLKYRGTGPAGKPVQVDLIGAVHIGERSYYDELNRLFRGYEAVLYELVAPPHARVPEAGQRSGHPVGFMQQTMKNVLELEFQLDRINYRRSNLVHADLSPEEFDKSMAERGESLPRLMFRLMGQGVAQQSTDPARSNDFALLGALFSPQRSRDLKRLMAEQFEEVERANSVINGPNGSTILTVRNARALKVLKEQLDAGRQKVAIFYGAAHLPDLADHLQRDHGLAADGHQWLEAWDLR